MFINRPLIKGKSSVNQISKTSTINNHSNASSIKLRIKTVAFNQKNASQTNILDHVTLKQNLIGHRNIKQMIQDDIFGLIQSLNQLGYSTHQEDLSIQQRLIKRSRKLSKKSIDSNLDKPEKVSIQQQQNAYSQCLQFLQNKNTQEQKIHTKTSNNVEIQFYQYQQTFFQLNQTVSKLKNQLKQLRSQLLMTDKQLSLIQRKSHHKLNILEQIQNQRKSIEEKSNKLFELQQKSLDQKSKFVQIQAQQMRLIQLSENQSQKQRNKKQNQQSICYYSQLCQLKQKLLLRQQKQRAQIQSMIHAKIENISKTRLSIDIKSQQIQQILSKTQQQTAIISMLMNKFKQQQKQPNIQLDLQQQYRQQYYRIYFDHNRDENNIQQDITGWKGYRKELQNILPKHRLSHPANIKTQPSITKEDFYSHATLRDDSFYERQLNFEQQSNQLRQLKKHYQLRKNHYQNDSIKNNPPVNKYIRKRNNKFDQGVSYQNHLPITNLNKNPNKLIQNQIQSPIKQSFGKLDRQNKKNNTSFLPRLIKIQGKLQDQGKIKNQLTKFTHKNLDSDIQLMTVQTDQQNNSKNGQIIQVQFRGKSPYISHDKRKNLTIHKDSKITKKPSLNNIK